MGRITVLDGLRGACLVFMTITHLEFGRPFLLGYAHFKHLGFADSAQAFIFLSGLLVGIIGLRQRSRAGDAPVARRYRVRALELYGWHLALLLVVLTASRLLPGAWAAWDVWLAHLFEDGAAYAVATAGLLYQPTYLDILTQYILYLLAAPLVLRMIAEGRTGLVIAGMVVLWLAAQAGLHLAPAAWVERTVVIGGVDVVLRSAFNPLGWQLAFGAGLVIGALFERGDLTAGRLFPPRGGLLPQIALGVLLGLMALRLSVAAGLMDAATNERVGEMARRQDLGLLPALNFAALAYLTGWLLAAAPDRGEAWLRHLGRGLRNLFGHTWLVTLGKHALPVFCFHVVLMYALRYVDWRLGGVPDPWFSLAALAAIASLFLVAAALEARRRATAATPPKAAEPS